MTEAEHKAIEGRALLLYDGVCALCNSSVRFIMKHDRPDQFRYAPLDSELGREMLARFNIHAFPEGGGLGTQTLQPGERISLRAARQRGGAPDSCSLQHSRFSERRGAGDADPAARRTHLPPLRRGCR